MYFPQSLGEARASFLVNLAGVYGLRSEFDKARKCLQQVLSFLSFCYYCICIGRYYHKWPLFGLSVINIQDQNVNSF